MKLESVRELKALLAHSVPGSQLRPATAQSLNRPARAVDGKVGPERTVAFGIRKRSANDFVLAVRLQRRGAETIPEIEKVIRRAKTEVDVRYVGRVQKLATPWYRQRCRPLRIGCSVAHHAVTAGTLGCFVRSRKDGSLRILSNNHVLANENNAKEGDEIVQPGPADLGRLPRDVVARLSNFVPLKTRGRNLVDAATAVLSDEDLMGRQFVSGLGKINGLGPAFLEADTRVAKLGRTTGLTRGRVTAFELDNVVVGYDIGSVRFDNQVEIEGDGDAAFSDGGDSGSLILDEERRGVALLFAGSDQGGSNNQGLTFANPLKAVVDALGVDLL